MHYIYLSSGQQQLSRKNQLGTLSVDFNEYLTVIPDIFYMTSYIKKRLKALVGISKPKIVRYESCMTLNQETNNVRKSQLV